MRFRSADDDDVRGLTDLEEAANLVGLAHVFDGRPFPRAAVEQRWRETLADPEVVVEAVDGAGRLDCFLAHDRSRLRHLAVHPDRWGSGLGRAAVERAAAAIRRGGAVPRLWCLAENHRALGLYTHLGWTATGVEQRAEWPPYPVERELVLAGSPP